MAIWKEYFENAYISCFHYLVNKRLHWSERLFWLITLIICMCCTCVIILRSTIEFNTQKPTFRVDTNYLDWETPFPSIVVCEISSVSTRVLAIERKLFPDLPKNSTLVRNLMSSASDMAFHKPPNFGETVEDCRRYPEKCLKGNFSYYMNKIRGNCSDLLTECQYNGIKFKCDEQFLPVNTVFGKCFAFNNYMARLNGTRTKQLKWMIKREPNKEEGELIIEFKHPQIQMSISGSYAIPTTENLFLLMQTSGADPLVPSTIYNFFYKIEQIITMDEERHVPVVDRECRFPEENYLEYFDIYTESNCETECYIKAQKKVCNCSAHSTPVISPSEECDLFGLMCTHENEEIAKYMAEECKCLANCNTTYLQRIGYYEIKEVDKKMFFHKDTIARFKISVPAPTITYLRYTFKSTLDIIVSIGGAVSFFLGFSFLSIAQVLYYFLMRTVTDQYRLKHIAKTQEKQRNMNDVFRTGRLKLKLVKVENDIRANIEKKIANKK